MSLPIPQPPGVPLLGNINDVDPNNGTASLMHLADKYGPIYKLSLLGHERVFISSFELANELFDEKRFCKNVAGPLNEVRNGVHDGLFTAHHGEPNWGAAHRTLVPAFGPLGIKDMFDEMYDIATQLVSKWARLGPEERINVTDDYTRLTLDSIALCAMDKRFNSFYKEDMHPFVHAMVGFLLESGRRPRRTRIEAFLNPQYERQYLKDIDTMRTVAAEVVAYRRANPSDKKDLLNAMLFGKDPQTGQRLSDETIMNNMITFLIAGHETTAGLLSFTSYYLLNNPEAMQKAQKEVDDVVGRGPITYQHMSKLPYVEACLRESLRLSPTAPALSVRPLPGSAEPVVIGGKYHVANDQSLVVILPQLGRDPAVFGADANEYRPERMFGENFSKMPQNAWKPFGNGARGCIGRPFAWQEAVLALAMVLQNFNLRFDDPSYQLHNKQTLTIKPADFFMRANLREGIDPIHLEKRLFSGSSDISDSLPPSKKHERVQSLQTGKKMSIYYGSNSGTCEGLSQTLAGAAASHGYQAKVQTLDSAVDRFPTDQPVVMITASYEGEPTDNAGQFVQWLKNVEASKVSGSKFAVFGCGHHDWVSTYQKIPKLVESILTEKGATSLVMRGETDVALGKIFDDFDEWQDNLLWPALTDGARSDKIETAEVLDVDISTSTRATHLHHNVQDAQVLKNELLSPPGAPEKRHIEVKLPTNMTYEAGDYLAILPVNPIVTISRVLRRFALPWDAMMTIKKGSRTTIPTDHQLPVMAVLGAYVELGGPASRKNLATIAQYADEATKSNFQGVQSPLPSLSVLEVLEAHPMIPLPFSVYLSMLTPMRIRQYSISSSPLADPTIASITFAVVDDNDVEHPHLGVATNFLRMLKPGATVQLSVKKSHAAFHLPLDDAHTPLIMVAAGTGIAPFRGFVQERATKIATAKEMCKEHELAEAVLFIGCRGPQEDLLYKDLLDEWEKAGAVKVYHAFSRASDGSEGCKYAQDRLWDERETVTRLFRSGARAYICGSGRLGKGVADTVAKIVMENGQKDGKETTYERALKWWEGLRGERFAVDVFD